MKSRPILFSGPMILALLDGSKTQTRRIIKNDPYVVKYDITSDEADGNIICHGHAHAVYDAKHKHPIPCPYGAIGDRLWIKETYRSQAANDSQKPIDIEEGDPIRYEADEHEDGNPLYGWGRIRQSIYMRHWMSRLTLEITNVRVERLQDISPHDALAEGVGHNNMGNPVIDYQNLWDSINAEKGPGEHGYAWAGNPWVWALTFKRITP